MFGILAILYSGGRTSREFMSLATKLSGSWKVTTIMVIILIAWCVVTVFKTGAHLPPLPRLENMKLDHEFLAGFSGTRLSHIMWIVGFVGMGIPYWNEWGRTLAQVNREIESPKLLISSVPAW